MKHDPAAHDPFCSTQYYGFCNCDFIAQIRADEAELAAARVAAYADLEGIGLKAWFAAVAAARGEAKS